MSLFHLFDTPTHRSFTRDGMQVFLPRAHLAEALAVMCLEDAGLSPEDPDVARLRRIGLAAGEPWFIQCRWIPQDVPEAEADAWTAARICEKAARGDPGARCLRAVRSDLALDGAAAWAAYRMSAAETLAELRALAAMGHHAPMRNLAFCALFGGHRWTPRLDCAEALDWIGRACAMGDVQALEVMQDAPWGEEALAAQPPERREEIEDRRARLRPGYEQPSDFLTSW